MYSYKSKNKSRFFSFKLIFIFVLFIVLGFTTNIYLNSKYNSLLSNFYNKFNNHEFSDAKSILNNKILTLKKHKLNEDLTYYFTDIIDKICTSLSNNSITTNKSIEILNEIKGYNVLNSSLDTLISSLNENNENYTGISSNNNTQVSENTSSNYKDSLLESVEELVANKYYTKAIDILSDYDPNLLTNEEITEIENKINSIKLFREEYSYEDSEYTANAILQEITPDNINSLSISSKTPYLVYLNLDKQITYVYEGSNNNWNIIKEFTCSTGLEGKETPKGIFSVTNRGDWFYSEEFQQGGKYWVQFMGDYLFHSVPFDESQSTILDYTLGVPSSHGCIRLNVEDAKWLYDNISNDTKIIIN